MNQKPVNEDRFLSCQFCDGAHSESDCPDNPDNQKPVDDKELVWQILDQAFAAGLNHEAPDWPSYKSIKPQLIKRLNAHYQKKYEKVDRFEVIDETGRAYVKGSIYGSPVKVKLSLQDDDRTLKIFVETIANIKSEGGE